MFKALRGALTALLFVAAGLPVPALGDSTINPQVPVASSSLTSAPIRNNFAAAYNDVRSLLNKYAATSAPANPVQFQWWVDTSASPRVLKIYDGTNWLALATIDTSGHTLSVAIPAPTLSTLGGVKSTTAVANQFLTALDTTGTFSQAQPSAASLSNGTTGTGSVVLGTSPTVAAPVLSGTVTGTYTLGGTPTISAPALSGTVIGTYTLGGTPTINDPTIGGFIQRPQGRLTLTSGTPVLAANATAQTTIYYTPYNGNLVPVYDGTRFVNKTFTELSEALATSGTNFPASGSVYDLFVINDSGTIRLCNGPAWSSTTSRGTGAGTTELQMLTGIWTNKNSIAACRFGSVSGNTVAVSANQGTYVGTFYATGNGQTGMNFTPAAAAGGANPFLALYNAYNRVLVRGFNQDSTSSWTYSTATWRASNNSTSNRINWVDGLAQSQIDIGFNQMTSTAGGATANNGVGIDSTTGPLTASSYGVNNAASTLGAIARGTSLPLLGFHFAQALEISSGATSTYYGANNYGFYLNIEM
jgi:hypothetical protein